MKMPKPALVLFAHGSRDPGWRLAIEAVASQVHALAPGLPMRCAYLEWSTPDLPQAVAELVAEGATHLRVLPLFLGVGRHAREDLPVLLRSLAQQHPGLDIEGLPAIGEHPAVTRLLADIALQDIAGRPQPRTMTGQAGPSKEF
jgi:sirohydrochlorin cobaltochelatase